VPLEHWIAGAVMVSLTLYALGGGADFGGGVWDLLSSGPRARKQRELIAHAIGPIWEANHVWLILGVVLLFVCFPIGWAALSTALHVPLTLMLLGVVLRGSAFTFRSYDDESDAAQRRWGRMFAVASVLTPLMLGVCVGAVAAGRVQVRDGRVLGGFVRPWLAPFPFAVGALAVALFAFLAAVYLILEAREPALREDFRRRALAAGVATGGLAFVTLGLARGGAPLVWEGLVGRHWSLPLHAATAVAATGALAALWARRFAWARPLAVLQVTLILWGWGAAQFPYLVPPDLTFSATAAPPAVLRAVLGALGAGAMVLVPSLFALYRVFKSARTESGA
jgi:cytochrome d ubiquinol oxidase subunit II